MIQFFSPSPFGDFVIIIGLIVIIIGIIIKAIITVIKYLVSIPKKKKQEEKARQLEEKVRTSLEEWVYFHDHVTELEKAYENASSREEKEAAHKQLMDFMDEHLE